MPLTIVQHRVPSRGRRRATDNMDDDVDAAETIMNGLHHHRASLGGSDVGGNEKIRGNGVAGCRAGGDEDLGTGLRQPRRYRLADPPGATGDQGPPAVKFEVVVHHRVSWSDRFDAFSDATSYS